MRPILLTLSGFGPFAAETSIDFSKLGAAGLYLIEGETGSGKTTIFDAITFALFGKASGKVRPENSFRSQYAEAKCPTFVQLDFELHQKRYQVRRSPSYLRPALRGSGMVTQNAEASMTFPDGRRLVGTREVNSAVEALLGVDDKQFSQIAMIAQGEFSRLLFANTSDRREILRHLLHTERYEAFQNKLREKHALVNSEYERSAETIRAVLSGVVVPETLDSAPFEEICALDVVPEKDELAGFFDEYEKTDTLLLEQNALGAQALEKEKAKCDGDLAVAETVERARENLRAACEALEKNRPLLEKCRVDREHWRVEGPRLLEKLAASIASIEQSLPDYERLDAVKKKIALLDQALAAERASEEKTVLAVTKSEKKLAADTALREKLGNAEAKKIEAAAARDRKKERLDAISALIKQRDELMEKETLLNQTRTDFKKAVQKSESKRLEATNAEREFLAAQAGLLAETLTNGKACPVCGATTHPTPAVCPKTVPKREALDKLRTKADSLFEAANELSAQVSRLSGEYDQRAETFRRDVQKLFEAVSPKEAVSRIDSEYDAAKDDWAVAQAAAVRADDDAQNAVKLDLRITETKKTLDAGNQALIEVRAKITESSLERLTLISQRDEIAAGCTFDDLSAARKQRDTWAKEKADQEQLRGKIETDYERLSADVARDEGVKKRLEAEIAEKPVGDISALKKQLKELALRKSAWEKQRGQIDRRREGNRTARRQFESESDRRAEIQNRRREIADLSATINGTTAGTDRLKLETWVQQTFFDRILRRANHRFDIMTNGQYQMKRSVSATVQRSDTGLDLDVFDRYGGGARAVTTLSGGESFTAALALALGLADEIQSSVGGVSFDTLFVDEGFGTLSDEYRRRAVDLLASLAGSDRLVGVISHVTELRDRILRRISVTRREGGGSTAAVSIE